MLTPPLEIRPLTIRGKAGHTLTFPFEMFAHSNSHIIEDETGKRYITIGPEMFCFHGVVPAWSINTLTFWVEGDVGKMFRVVEE